jgi:hypothetical protein
LALVDAVDRLAEQRGDADHMDLVAAGLWDRIGGDELLGICFWVKAVGSAVDQTGGGEKGDWRIHGELRIPRIREAHFESAFDGLAAPQSQSKARP